MRRRALLLALAALVALPGAARAQGLASPGPLAQPHARLDDLTRCLNCHERGRELSGRKCLACHVALNARIAADKGFHATATRHGAALACATCHSEHNGRPYRLVRWEGGSPDAFDHTKAGFTLTGAHARARCTDCHREGLVADARVRSDSSVNLARTYLGLGTTCVACHLDEHRGRLSRDCATCHNDSAWKPVPKFDHAKTRFPLTGRHATVRCEQCHAQRRDLASGPGGARDTSFVDFHAKVMVGSGRRVPVAAGAPPGACASCHTSPHNQAGMTRCESCHTVDGWFVLPDSIRRFDHAPTGFPLRGAHAAARCEFCHLADASSPQPDSVPLVRANFLRPLARQRQKMAFDRCDACHLTPHRGQLQRLAAWDCVACHDETAFTPTSYGPAAHDSTGFPLTGAHAAVPCASCHRPLAGGGKGRIAFRIADRTCAGCHRDPHGGQFAPRTCDACHTTEAWLRVTSFDHDQTRYPLRGAHRSVACDKCHKAAQPGAPVRFAGLPMSCEDAACHGDPHGGQFADRARGSACTTCHTEDGWRPAHFDHQTDSDYPLDGAHRTVPCASCHTADAAGVRRFRPLPHRCEDCHRGGSPS